MCSHFWRNGLPAGEMLGHVDRMGVPDVASAHRVFTNVASNVPRGSV